MAKLHARISSEKGNRVVTMSGDIYLSIEVQQGNNITHRIAYTGDFVQINTIDKSGVITESTTIPRQLYQK